MPGRGAAVPPSATLAGIRADFARGRAAGLAAVREVGRAAAAARFRAGAPPVGCGASAPDIDFWRGFLDAVASAAGPLAE